jgi:hypothetical protein
MPDYTLDQTATAFIEHLRQAGKKERTLYTYNKDLELIGSYFGVEKKLTNILIPHVSKFLKSDDLLKLKNGKDRAKPTIDKTMRVFRMMLSWARDEGMINTLPFRKELSLGRSLKKEKDDVSKQPNTSEAPAEA